MQQKIENQRDERREEEILKFRHIGHPGCDRIVHVNQVERSSQEQITNDNVDIEVDRLATEQFKQAHLPVCGEEGKETREGAENVARNQGPCPRSIKRVDRGSGSRSRRRHLNKDL